MLSQLNRIYTRQPPHSEFWAGTNSASDAAEQPGAQMVGAHALMLENGKRVEALVLENGERVEALFEVGGKKQWFGGVVVVKNAGTGSYHVKFDDEEESDFTGDKHASLAFDCAGDDSDLCYPGDDPEFRRESWPWADWLKLYLPDLLLTVYRAARRNASLSHTLYFDQLQNPEHFLDSVLEFHHSNFCDVRILRFEEADTASSAGTPAQTKRRRS